MFRRFCCNLDVGMQTVQAGYPKAGTWFDYFFRCTGNGDKYGGNACAAACESEAAKGRFYYLQVRQDNQRKKSEIVKLEQEQISKERQKQYISLFCAATNQS